MLTSPCWPCHPNLAVLTSDCADLAVLTSYRRTTCSTLFSPTLVRTLAPRLRALDSSLHLPFHRSCAPALLGLSSRRTCPWSRAPLFPCQFGALASRAVPLHPRSTTRPPSHQHHPPNVQKDFRDETRRDSDCTGRVCTRCGGCGYVRWVQQTHPTCLAKGRF